MLSSIAVVLFLGLVTAIVGRVIEKDSSIKTFLMNFVIGAAGAVWTLFALACIIPQFI